MIVVKKTMKRNLDHEKKIISNNYKKKLNLITRKTKCNLKDIVFLLKGIYIYKS